MCCQVDSSNKSLFFFSDLCDHAEEWSGPAHGKLVLLGQLHRWELHRAMGEQDHVLHRQRLRPVHLTAPPPDLSPSTASLLSHLLTTSRLFSDLLSHPKCVFVALSTCREKTNNHTALCDLHTKSEASSPQVGRSLSCRLS